MDRSHVIRTTFVLCWNWKEKTNCSLETSALLDFPSHLLIWPIAPFVPDLWSVIIRPDVASVRERCFAIFLSGLWAFCLLLICFLSFFIGVFLVLLPFYVLFSTDFVICLLIGWFCLIPCRFVGDSGFLVIVRFVDIVVFSPNCGNRSVPDGGS